MGGVSGGILAAALLHHRSARPKFLSDRPLKELFSLGLPSEKAKDQSYIRDVPVGSRHLHRMASWGFGCFFVAVGHSLGNIGDVALLLWVVSVRAAVTAVSIVAPYPQVSSRY